MNRWSALVHISPTSATFACPTLTQFVCRCCRYFLFSRNLLYPHLLNNLAFSRPLIFRYTHLAQSGMISLFIPVRAFSMNEVVCLRWSCYVLVSRRIDLHLFFFCLLFFCLLMRYKLYVCVCVCVLKNNSRETFSLPIRISTSFPTKDGKQI